MKTLRRQFAKWLFRELGAEISGLRKLVAEEREYAEATRKECFSDLMNFEKRITKSLDEIRDTLQPTVPTNSRVARTWSEFRNAAEKKRREA